jgi:hypothetical protein
MITLYTGLVLGKLKMVNNLDLFDLPLDKKRKSAIIKTEQLFY